MKSYTNIFILLVFFPLCLFGQQDSIVLLPDQLELDDINIPEKAEAKQQIFIGTRSLQDLDDLPFTTHVITKDEIRENGYRTLVDALRMQPGIRISQPGSALEGEMFMVRGHSGNANMKILLNGYQIKPSTVKGMPIGAQLPIQQAERIEIIYGAMGTLHSDNGSAGVINIVLEETPRPVYTQANLSIGTNDFINLDVSFGGRLGKQKHTLRYSLFGNYTSRSDTKIQHSNDTIFSANQYPSRILDSRNIPNYISINDEPLINELPHQSGMVGLDLAYRGMKFSAQVMNRRDHSALGMSPTAISYANPTNYLGERILNTNFSINKNWKRIGLQYNIQYLQYRMDQQSSTNYVDNLSSHLLDTLSYNSSFDPTQGFDFEKYDSLTRSHLARFFNDSRFSYSESRDLRTEIIANLYLIKNVGFKVGIRLDANEKIPFYSYSRVPLGSSNSNLLENSFHQPSGTLLRPYGETDFLGVKFSRFANLDASWKKLFFVGQVNWMTFSENGFISFGPSPSGGQDILEHAWLHSLGASYKLNKSFIFRVNHSSAVRFHSPHYKMNTFSIALRESNNPFASSPILPASSDILPERTNNLELGLKWIQTENASWNISAYHTSTTNRMASGIQKKLNDIGTMPELFTQGYFSSGVKSSWWGIQSEYAITSQLLDIIFNISYTFDRTTEDVPPDFSEVIGLYETPRNMRTTRTIFRPTENFSLTFDNVFMGKSRNRVVGRPDLKKYRMLDILANYQINRNFRIFFKARNVFNNEASGLNAAGNRDDLIYNPQEFRNFRVGMSYRVD